MLYCYELLAYMFIKMKLTNRITFFSLFLFSLFSVQLTSCSYTPEAAELLNKTLQAYERAIRWRNYNGARAFHIDPEEFSDFKRQRLMNIRVTSYKTIGQNVAPDYTKAELIVDIRYYYDNSAVERVLTMRQTWLNNKENNRWRLESAFPDFRFK